MSKYFGYCEHSHENLLNALPIYHLCAEVFRYEKSEYKCLVHLEETGSNVAELKDQHYDAILSLLQPSDYAVFYLCDSAFQAIYWIVCSKLTNDIVVTNKNVLGQNFKCMFDYAK